MRKDAVPSKQADDTLIARFVALFPEEVLAEADVEPQRPVPLPTPREALGDLHLVLPARLPPLYEQLILSYRWPEVDLGPFRLLANPLGPGLAGLLAEMQQDRVMWEELIPRGWIRFGKGADLNYDPVCFDLRRRRKDGDYPIVQLDHEELLCFSRIREVAQLASSFRELVEQVVAEAQR